MQTLKIYKVEQSRRDYKYTIVESALELKYELEYVDNPNTADLSISFVYGPNKPPAKYHSKHIALCAEWVSEISVDNVDLLFSHLSGHEKKIFCPFWVHELVCWYGTKLIEDIQNRVITPKTKFAAFVSNIDFKSHNSRPLMKMRYGSAKYVSDNYKEVFIKPDMVLMEFGQEKDPIHRYCWGYDGLVDSKVGFLKDFKFNFAYENTYLHGYSTEKLIHAMRAGVIPIHAGDGKIFEDVNKEALIFQNHDDSYEHVLNQIKFYDQSDEAYFEMLDKPSFITDVADKYSLERYLDIIENIL